MTLTSFITLILLSPAERRTTSNLSFTSSTAATGAAAAIVAETPHFCSNFLLNSANSRTVRDEFIFINLLI